MPALNFGAFMAGFATQAQKIEEESAKIGMELIKEAIEDFREESKDWKSKYNTELKSWEAIAKNVKGMFGNDKQAELKTIAVLEKGKPYALDFIKSAQEQAKMKGFTSPAQLIDFGDQTLPKGISAIDWVRSGAPDMSLEAKPFLDKGQFTGMKTGVFGRQIYPEGMGRIERTEKTYLDTPVGIRKPLPQAEFTDIYSTTEVPGPLSRTDRAAFKRDALNVLKTRSSALAGLNFNVDGSPNYENVSAEAMATAEKHAQQIMDTFQAMYDKAKTLETAPNADDIELLASGLADEFDNFYDVKPLDLSEDDSSGNGAQPQPQPQAQPQAQTGGTIKSVTPQIASHPSVANLVTLPSNWQSLNLPKGKGARRQAIAQALKKLGVDSTVADQYSQNVTLN